MLQGAEISATKLERVQLKRPMEAKIGINAFLLRGCYIFEMMLVLKE